MIELIQGDFNEKIKLIKDKSVDLIMFDPPYFEIKGKFDFIWNNFEDYLKDFESWIIELKRVLKDNGSLFVWGHAKNIAYQQVVCDKYFNLLNNLVWEKKECQTKRSCFEELRRFAPVTERCLFYDKGEDKSGLSMIYSSPNLFQPIKQYMRLERKKIMEHKNFKTKAAFNVYIRKITNTSSVVHYFADSQWMFPTNEIYNKLQTTGFFQKEYEALREEYEALRRPFFNGGEVGKITDVINWSQETSKHHRHPTKKPLGLIKKIIEMTVRDDAVILDPMMGSGTTGAAVVRINKDLFGKSNLNFIGIELDKEYFEIAKNRIEGGKQ